MIFPEVISSDVFRYVAQVLDTHGVSWWKANDDTLFKLSHASSKADKEGDGEEGPVGRDSEASLSGPLPEDPGGSHVEPEVDQYQIHKR